MSEKKFIDLGPQIAEGTGYDPGSRGHLAQLSTLHWLDAHPEADPANEEHEEFVNDICELLPERYDDDVAAEAIVLWAVRDLVARDEAKRTITVSEISKAFGTEYVAWARLCLARIGVTVVPDPEPTNSQQMFADLEELTGDGFLLRDRHLEKIAKHLTDLGWTKTPEANDDL
ncbi:Uncharacterised protein [Brevibacterium casei]|uniref:Uncharacterized protein n=1 Tax=Brevibacterium casei TaxID=33889 RepID=A0A449D7F9_9MICO|nr:hypothetical protein [Brevibacterium casei]VEW13537.1 Uncharacterised protein [Brevibacterium casei]